VKIAILPMGDVPRGSLTDLSDALAAYGLACEVRHLAELPPAARDATRAQYDADAVLEALPRPTGETLLAVTTEDLFSGAYTFVFGLATIGGGRAIVSLRRLETADASKMGRRFRKEAIHELGHAWGLRHCDEPGCVMAFSNNLAEVDAKGDEPCARCWAILPFALARASHA